MPLSIDQYTNWAAFNAKTEVALAKGATGLENASNQVGALARFFGTKSAQSVRADVMADFTRALSLRYGVSLAHEALAAAGLTPTSKLDGKTIASVDAYARFHSSAAVDSLMLKPDIKLMKGSVTRAEIDGYSSLATRSYLCVRRMAIDVLGEMPLDKAAADDFRKRCDNILRQLAPTANPGATPTNPAARKLHEDALALTKAITDKKANITALLEGRPLSPDNVKSFKTVWAEGAMLALLDLKEEFSSSDDILKAINTVGSEILKDEQSINAFLDSMPVEKDMQKALAKTLLAKLKAAAPAKAIPFKEDFMAKQIAAGYRKALNRGDWSVITKPITSVIGGKPVELTSKIVPGSHIGADSDDGTGPIGAKYDPGVKGYMCHSADTAHAVNLAVTSLSVKDASGNDHLAFSGIRHGVHCAWEISDSSERAKANVKRAEEAVIAAFLSDPANMQKVRNGEPLRMTSVSLLTPDVARHIKGSKSSDERLMLREQKAAWDKVSDEGVEFTYNGETFHIKPQVFTMNFGVNAGAVKFGVVAPNLAGGWGMSDDMNYQAYKDMRPLVADFIKDPSIPKDKRETVRKLFNQCMDVMCRSGERSDSHDAYKVAARFAVMTHLMGWTPCWNCKSGKDRTGEMDVECKFLATLIAQGEEIPEPGAKLTPEQKSLFRAIAFEGGNFEMQKYNTGFGGFKTGGVSSIPERLGGEEYREFHKGGSSSVGV